MTRNAMQHSRFRQVRSGGGRDERHHYARPGRCAGPTGRRLTFDTAAYFTATGRPASTNPTVSVTFTLADPARRYHVPVLLSPFALEPTGKQRQSGSLCSMLPDDFVAGDY